jgi:hypothetical protein
MNAERDLDDVEHLRLMAEVARLYYTHGLRQSGCDFPVTSVPPAGAG